jgi:hypothetical protein
MTIKTPTVPVREERWVTSLQSHLAVDIITAMVV